MTRSRCSATFSPPVMQARRWLEGVQFADDQPLINVSQAAPTAPPPRALRQAIADTALNRADAHLYGPVLGLPALREELAAKWAGHYGGPVGTDHIAITAGCNQAFCATIAALCDQGDEVILPTPWYFNHKMWLDMAGVTTVPLPAGPGLLPDPARASTLITPRTKALVLVTPNNPGGVEYPATLIAAWAELAHRHGIHLILDETYRDFHSQPGPPHQLLQNPDWAQTVVQLYSFSKSYRLTGHRVGAIIAAPALQMQIEKFLDTVTICPAQLGQHAALWGLQNLSDWLGGERQEVLNRRATIQREMPGLAAQGWKLLGLGAYFAYLEHPYEMGSDHLARQLVQQSAILCLPGTMFTPAESASGRQQMRIAFANIDSGGIAALFDRLRAFQP